MLVVAKELPADMTIPQWNLGAPQMITHMANYIISPTLPLSTVFVACDARARRRRRAAARARAAGIAYKFTRLSKTIGTESYWNLPKQCLFVVF